MRGEKQRITIHKGLISILAINPTGKEKCTHDFGNTLPITYDAKASAYGNLEDLNNCPTVYLEKSTRQCCYRQTGALSLIAGLMGYHGDSVGT